mmetsp:Transcript_164254/g.526766  ORF Transcript_164254/g.526766 Transcript_164254/m.526766 type:complete len:207 (+) Transcript_164254:1897-2517(+)
MRPVLLSNRALHLGDLFGRHVLVKHIPSFLLRRATQIAFVCSPCRKDTYREEEKRQGALPDLDNVRRKAHEDNEYPHIGEDRPDGCDDVHTDLLDVAHLPGRNGKDAHCNDDLEVEGGTAHDGARTEALEVELLRENVDETEQDLGRAGAQRHQRQVGDRGVPELKGVVPLLFLVPQPEFFRSHLFDASHEGVSDDGHAGKAVEQA